MSPESTTPNTTPQITDITEDAVSLARSAAELAEIATRHALKFYATTLDFSAKSIADVELILGRLSDQVPRTWLAKKLKRSPSPDEVFKIGMYYGCYLGEVIRREFGGEWRMVKISGSDPTMAIRWGEGNMSFPVSKAHKRLFEGEGDNVEVFYRFVREKHGNIAGK